MTAGPVVSEETPARVRGEESRSRNLKWPFGEVNSFPHFDLPTDAPAELLLSSTAILGAHAKSA